MKCTNNHIVRCFIIHVVLVFFIFTPQKRHFLHLLITSLVSLNLISMLLLLDRP